MTEYQWNDRKIINIFMKKYVFLTILRFLMQNPYINCLLNFSKINNVITEDYFIIIYTVMDYVIG